MAPYAAGLLGVSRSPTSPKPPTEPRHHQRSTRETGCADDPIHDLNERSADRERDDEEAEGYDEADEHLTNEEVFRPRVAHHADPSPRRFGSSRTSTPAPEWPPTPRSHAPAVAQQTPCGDI